MIDKVTFYNSNNALEPTSLVICNGIVELVQVLRKLEKPKYSIFNFLLLYFWQKVNLQLLFIADLKHKCVDEEHKKTKPGRQAGAFLHCYSWKMSKRTGQLCSVGDCDLWSPSLDCDLPHSVQPRSLDHVQLWNTKSRSHPGSGQFIIT